MNLDITLEEAKIMLASLNNSTELKAKLQKIVDDAKPKEKDFNSCPVWGWDLLGYNKSIDSKTLFRTRQQVDAAKALAQLTQWYGNLKIEDKDLDSLGLCTIVFWRDDDDKIFPTIYTVTPSVMWDNAFLVFSNEKIAQDFIDSHKTLLMQASYFLI